MKKAILRDALKVLAVGGSAAGMGAAAVLLAILSVWMYCTIPAVIGYAAVILFLTATMAAAGALAVVYFCGCWMIRKGRFSR